MKSSRDIVPPQFQKYVGMRPPIPMADQWHRAHQLSFTCITELLAAAETSFGQIARNTLWLCAETHDYLYKGTYGHIDGPYRAGSRPMLEKFIAQSVRPGMSDREKAISLNQSMAGAIPKQFGQVPFFLYGETDEETLLKGGGHCSCQGRLLSACCQIVGLQARPVIMWVVPDPNHPQKLLGGHTCTEVFFDGGWHFFDPSLHWYPVGRDGRIPSLAELRDDRSIATEMPAEVETAQQPKMPVRKIMDQYLPPGFPIAISRHDVNVDYPAQWTWATSEFLKKRDEDWAAIKAIVYDLAKRGELTDDIYYLDLAGFRKRFGITKVNLHPPVISAKTLTTATV